MAKIRNTQLTVKCLADFKYYVHGINQMIRYRYGADSGQQREFILNCVIRPEMEKGVR